MRPFAILLAAVPCALLLQAIAAGLSGSAPFGKSDLAATVLLAAAAAVPGAIAASGRLRQAAWARRLLLLEAACGVGLLLAEAGLWVVLSGADARPMPWPPGIRMETDISGVAAGVSGPDLFSTNSRGLRGPEPSPDDAIRVVSIGGSTTECLYLGDAEEWPALSAAALARATGKRVWLGNAGRSGHTTREHLLQVERLPEVGSADAVVVLCGINDLTSHLAGTWEKRGKGAEESAFWSPLRRWQPPGDGGLPWFRYSRVYTGITRLWRDGVGGRDPGREVIQDTKGTYYRQRRAVRASLPKRDGLPDLGPALAAYRGMLERLAGAARARGVPLLLLTQPTIYAEPPDPAIERLLWFGAQESDGFAWSAGALARGVAAFNEEMVRVAAEQGIACLRLDADLPRDAITFYDDCHFTEEGARRVAALVAPALRKVLEARGPRR